MASNSSGAKKTGARKVTARKVTSRKKQKMNPLVRDTMISVFLVAAGVFLFLSLITSLTGVVGAGLQHFILGLFGIGGFILPLIIIFAGIQLLLNKSKLKGRMFLSGFFLLFLSAFYNVIRFDVPVRAEGSIFSDYFIDLTEQLYIQGRNLTSGGVLGGYIGVPLTALCSRVGAGIILFVIIALTVVFVGKFTYDSITLSNVKVTDKETNKEIKVENRAVARELKTLRKEVEQMRKQDKPTKAYRVKQPPVTEEDLDKELDDIEKPYKEAAAKAESKKKDRKKETALIGVIPETDFEDTADTFPAEEVYDGPEPAVLGINPEFSEDDVFIPESVKPRKSDAAATEDTVIDDPLREMILRKVNEAEAKEKAQESVIEASLTDITPLTPAAKVDKKPEIDDTPDEVRPPEYIYPPISLLNYVPKTSSEDSVEELHRTAEKLMEALRTFNVETKVLDFSRGPTVTRYELQPLPGVKISRITNLADDIALHLAATAVRLEAPIPGKAAIGVEIPNKATTTVYLQEIVSSDEFKNAKSALSVCLGKDITGKSIVIDLAKMPHVLIAGATGSGKSVCINSLLISLLYKSSPEDVRLILVDPKVVELNVYNGIPHLLIPVVTDPRKAAGALSWAVSEMLKRYDLFKEKGVRDFAGYNRNLDEGEKKLPQIVIIIDEMADLMMTSKNEVEDSICRLAQMARAAGMHLVIATQRPSADVITGTIKTNIPSRIAFAVSSGIDSRIILDSSGAEKLVGKGDMLYDPLGAPKPLRVQGCFVSDKEVENVISFIKNNYVAEYDEEVLKMIEQKAKEQEKAGKGGADDDDDDEDDVMLPQAIEVVVNAGQASTSTLQRKLKLGYARAARIMDQMEERGIIGEYQGSKPREVLISRQEWLEMKSRWEGKFE